MTKRILALLLLAAMMLTCFVACKDNGDETGTTVAETETDAEPTEAPTDKETEPATAAPTEEPTAEPTEPATATPTEPATEEPTEPAETEPADGIYDTDNEKAQFACLSFDECEAWKGDAELVKFFTPGQPASCAEITDIPGESTHLRIWGWLGLKAEYASVGYKIDDAAPVFNEEWLVEADPAVVGAAQGNGGDFATRFRIWPDLTELTSGEHTVKALYKLADGTMVNFVTVKINVGYRKPVLDNTTKSFASDLAAQSGDFKASDLSGFFAMELINSNSKITAERYELAGFCEMVAKMDGKFAMTIKDFWTQTGRGSYAFVRGTKVVHSVDIPQADQSKGQYPINNYYETDGNANESCGGSGICVGMLDGNTMLVTVKYYDPEELTRISCARFEAVVDSADITILDDNDTIYIYSGSEIAFTVKLEGTGEYEDLRDVASGIHFAKNAIVTCPDGTVTVVENTLAVDNAASEIGFATRNQTLRFTAVEIGAPFAATDKASDPDFKHVSPDDIRLTADGTTLTLYAWGWVSVTKEIAGFGYQLDKNLPVWDDTYTVSIEGDAPVQQAVAATGGTYGSRFRVDATVENAAYGEHTVTYLIKYTDGTVTAFATKTAMIARPIISSDEDAACKAHISWDELDGWLNGGNQTSAFTPGQSASWDGVATIEKGAFDQLRVWGWVGCTQALDMNGFGYTINDSVYRVTDPTFAFETGADVMGASASMGGIEEGTSRFKIWVDIAGFDVGDYKIQAFYTLADGTIVEICSFTLKVTAPIQEPKYIITSASEFGGFNKCEVTDENGEYGPCILFLATDGDPHTDIKLNDNMNGCKAVAMKYRTTGNNNAEFFLGTGNGAHGGTDEVKFAYENDGEWHTLVIDLTKGEWGEKLGYIRYDFFPGNDGAIRVQYMAFCAVLQDAEAYAAAH